MSGWYERRRRADKLAAALREILTEADDLDGIARDAAGSRFAAVLKGSAYGLRQAVADLLDELRDDIEAAATGIDADDVGRGHPASPERIAFLLNLAKEHRP